MRCNFKKTFVIGFTAFVVLPLFSFPKTVFAENYICCKDGVRQGNMVSLSTPSTTSCGTNGQWKLQTECQKATNASNSTDGSSIIGNTCFEPTECVAYQGQISAKPVPECTGFGEKKYYCYAKMKPYNLQVHIGTTKVITGLEQYIATIYLYLIRISGIFAGVMIVYAGLKWMLAAGDPGKITDAKTKIFDALIGLILVLSAYTILNTINPALLRLSLTPIKLIRKEGIPLNEPTVLLECNTTSDCSGRLVYTACTGGSGTRKLMNVPMECQKKTNAQPGVTKAGICVVKTGGICRFDPYTCVNAAKIPLIGPIYDFFSGSNNNGTNSSSSYEGGLGCETGNACVRGRIFTEAEKGSDIRLWECKPGEVGQPCRGNDECPQGIPGMQCLTSVVRSAGNQRFCGALPAGPKKSLNAECTIHEECESGRCNEATEKCTAVGGSTEGTFCGNDLECTSRICATSLTPGSCAPLGGLPLNARCDNSHECGQCTNFDTQGRGTYPPNCTKNRHCIAGLCTTSPAPAGDPCFANSDCQNNFCFRTPPNIVGMCN